jgi:hypothetical protein
MANNCPPGLICFNYSKLLLIFLIIIFIIYYFVNNWKDSTNKLIKKNMNNINNNNKKYIKKKIEKMQNNTKEYITNTNSSIINANDSITKYQIQNTYSPQERIHNPLIPPERSNQSSKLNIYVKDVGVPINIATRGESGDFQQVGILVNSTNNKILPLYGRNIYPGSSKWVYYTSTDKFREIKLPILKNKQSCTSDHGCNELYDKDEVEVSAYNEKFNVTLYGLGAPQYIPYL